MPDLSRLLGMAAGCLIAAGAIAALAISPACGDPETRDRWIALATTTSVANSGLLDHLQRAFREQHGVDVRANLVGSGLALRLLSRGEVDAVISHAPATEASLLRDHPKWRYRKIMFNHFVIVGPRDDPAGVRGAPTVEDAMRRIASSPVRFLSRGDRSGTHEREEQLWALAGVRPAEGRLVVAGAGMGSTLRIAGETGAYTLTDRATFAQQPDTLALMPVFEDGPRLLNTYAVVVDPAAARARDGLAFGDWLSDGRGRDVIRDFRVGGNIQGFHVWPAGRPRGSPDDLPS